MTTIGPEQDLQLSLIRKGAYAYPLEEVAHEDLRTQTTSL